MRKLIFIAGTLFISGTIFSNAAQWPDLLEPAPYVGGGKKDAAVIMAVENYAFVAPVPGARSNANAWYDYLNKTRGVPNSKIFFNADSDVTAEDMKRFAGKAAEAVGEGGTLWYIFIGHGAPSLDGKQGLLVGVDAQQKAESINSRSLPQNDLVDALLSSKAGSVVLLVDSCFSGRNADGKPLVEGLQPLAIVPSGISQDSRLVVLTAAGGQEFAGQLPGAQRPAFSYLALGVLRGWADTDQNGIVTAEELRNYTDGIMRTMVKDRTQTPQLQGEKSRALAKSAGEKGPDLAALAKAMTGEKATSFEFKVSALPSVPVANAPDTKSISMPKVQMPDELGGQTGIDFGSVDVDALEKYDAVVKFEKTDVEPELKAEKWRALGKKITGYLGFSEKRAQDWDEYAAKAALNDAVLIDRSSASPEIKVGKWRALANKHPQYFDTSEARIREWNRYSAELKRVEEIRKKREALRDSDWSKLNRLLALSVVNDSDKRKFAAAFVAAYGAEPETNPYVIKLEQYLPVGTTKILIPVEEAPKSYSPSTSRGWAIGLIYPGGAIKHISENHAWELKAQSGSGILAVGPRYYRYISNSGLRLFLGLEADYMSFKGKVSKGSGWAGGGFVGGEIFLQDNLGLSMDCGPMYINLTDTKFSDSANSLEYVLNMGIYWHFK